MKAAQFSSYDDQSLSQTVSDAVKPSAGENQILVEVYAAAINPWDLKVREGIMGDALKFPAILGGDLSGVVAEAGADIEGFEVGQEVYGAANSANGQGSFAEFTPVNSTQLIAKPQNIDFEAAAAIPLTGVSAYQALVDHMKLQTGQKVLIHGGAGGIGTMAIQIASEIGAHVTTTAIAADHDYVKKLGAEQVIDYTVEDFSELLHDFDAVFDTVGGETNTKSYKVLKKGGILLSMVAAADEALAKEKEIHYIQQATKTTTERLTKISEMVEAGTLNVNVDKVFPLEQAGEALEYLKTGHPRGKVVIKVK